MAFDAQAKPTLTNYRRRLVVAMDALEHAMSMARQRDDRHAVEEIAPLIATINFLIERTLNR